MSPVLCLVVVVVRTKPPGADDLGVLQGKSSAVRPTGGLPAGNDNRLISGGAIEHPDGMYDLRLREKLTRRTVRVLSDQQIFQQLAPMSNLLQDCYAHGGGLIQPRNREEHLAIVAPIFTQNAQEIMGCASMKSSP